MCEQFIYKSVFAPCFNSFLEMKYAMGIDLSRIKWMFLEFDRFFIGYNVQDVYITKKHIDAWRDTRSNDKRKTLYDKYCVLRQFCRYLCHLGKECYIPRLPPKVSPEFTPYIFTHEQMQSIFEACDRLTMMNRNMHCSLFSIPALFRFLYSTGVRIGEALSIKNEDVDFAHQQIILKKTKNQMQRLIPLNTSLLAVLKQYEMYRNRMPLQKVIASDSFFFISPLGKPLVACTVLSRFKRILRECGIPYQGRQKGPRIHDFRHTCAVHSLMKMVRAGMDIYCALPVLSVFLGHKTIKGTEQYVRLTQEMYPEIIKMEQSVISFVFPVINHEIEINYGNN
jgi:integrase